jgi:Uma2 family endonuclease
MSIADKYRPQFSYEDYLLWEGRWELIEGMPYAMSPSPVREHQIINGNLHSIFKEGVKNGCSRCKTYLPIDWKVDKKTVVQPDLMVVCHPFTTKFLEITPSIVIEILSPSTAYKDRHEKYELYEQEKVKYYLIVDPQFKKMEIYELVEEKYQPVAITPPEFEFIIEGDCRFQIHFDDIWE